MILIVQRILPRYRYDVLKHLDSRVFRVLYSNDTKEGTLRSVAVSDPLFRPVSIMKFFGGYVQRLHGEIRKHRPSTVVFTPELKNFNFLPLLAMRAVYGFELVCWTHGINSRDFYTRVGWETWLRLMMMKLADRVLLYSHDRSAMLKRYLKKEIIVAPNTLDTPELDRVYHVCRETGKAAILNKYGIAGEFVFIFVGRLIPGKALRDAIGLFGRLAPAIAGAQFVIVGDGPEKPALEALVHNLGLSGQVVFMGEILDPQTVGELLYVADLQLHLGYVGLSVVNSMCFGTPVVTLEPGENGPYHSPEFSYLTPENALIGKDIFQLHHEILRLVYEPGVLEALQNHARITYQTQCQLAGFLKAFETLKQDSSQPLNSGTGDFKK